MTEPTDVVEREPILPQPQEGQEPKAHEAERKPTFRGNGLDMTALGALASGALVLLSCLSCGQAAYCLPVLPFLLGLIGLIGAKDSVDPKRTRLWSWLGIGSGAATLILAVFAVAAYMSFILFLILVSDAG